MPCALVTTRWACDLCGESFDSEAGAADCEARGRPPEVAPGWIVARWQGIMTGGRGEYLVVWAVMDDAGGKTVAHSAASNVCVRSTTYQTTASPLVFSVWWEQSGLLGDREDAGRFVPLDEVADEPGVGEALRVAEGHLRGLGLEPKPWRSGPPPWALGGKEG